MQRILAYYRERVVAHEQDRMQYLEKMEKLRIKQAEAHRIEWELKKRSEEHEELQRALANC